jgi:hypothetical protein
MKKIYYITAIALLFFLFSCEEDVVLDLGKIEKRLVVEAKITNDSPMTTVSLSYSQNFYDTPEYELLANATVVLENEKGEKELLSINSDHVYESKILQPEFGKNYKLTISVDGQEIEVSTSLPHTVPIASVNFVPNPFFGTPDSLNIFVNVADRVGENNFFRLRVNKINIEPSGEYYLVDDTFGKDGIISMPIYFKNFTFGDTVIVELYHLNETIYQYYSGLSENLSGSFNSIAPGNPVSNMPDDVYGYFAGYAIYRDTIVVGAMPF